MGTRTKPPAHCWGPYACFTLRAVVAGVLTWFFLFAWEFWIGDREQHIVVCKVFVPAARALGAQPSSLTPAQRAILKSQEDALMSVELRRKALVRVRMTHPELQPVDVKLRSTTFIDRGGPVIEISSVSTEPAYPAALINELMSERIAELERAREQTASYQAYWAASTPVLLAQREAGNLRKKLDSLPQDPSTSLARDSISAELEDAQKRWELAKDALAPLPPESERPVIMYANARSEPYEHALDPLTLVLHHPWRALTSLAVAVFLARFLVPKYRGAFLGAPSHEMAPS